jgi:hypothetical protein
LPLLAAAINSPRCSVAYCCKVNAGHPILAPNNFTAFRCVVVRYGSDFSPEYLLTITIGVLAGFIRRRPNLALLYLVDVIDFVDFPAADVMQPHQGLTFAETRMALQIFCASPKFAGLVITEINPDHDDKDGTLAKRLIDSIAQVLQQGGLGNPLPEP